MNNELKAFQTAKENLLKSIQTKWGVLSADAAALAGVMPDFVPPWRNVVARPGVGGRALAGMNLKQRIIAFVSDKVEERCRQKTIIDELVKQGYADSSVKSTVYGMENEKEVVDGFRLEKARADGDSYYGYFKVKVKENAVAGIGVTV